MGDAQIVPFGKYRGQPVEALAQDDQYREWLMAQPWFGERFPNLRTVIVNNFAAPEETPEHNALQALMLDDAWTLRFLRTVLGDQGLEKIGEAARADAAEPEWERAEGAGERALKAKEWVKADSDLLERSRASDGIAHGLDLARLEDRLSRGRAEQAAAEATEKKHMAAAEELERRTWKFGFRRRRFEDAGADVVVDGVLYLDGVKHPSWTHEFRIECKPAVGDDYPAILRQMKASKCDVLLIGDGGYTGRGANLEQVRAIFKASGIRVVLLRDMQEPTA